jgi:hypothetical protein
MAILIVRLHVNKKKSYQKTIHVFIRTLQKWVGQIKSLGSQQMLISVKMINTRPNNLGTRVVKKATNWPGTRYVCKALFSHNIFAHNITIKRYCDI